MKNENKKKYNKTCSCSSCATKTSSNKMTLEDLNIDRIFTLKSDAEKNAIINKAYEAGKEDFIEALTIASLNRCSKDRLTNGVAEIANVYALADGQMLLEIDVNGRMKNIVGELRIESFYDGKPVFAAIEDDKHDSYYFNINSTTFFTSKAFYGHPVREFDAKKDVKGKIFIYSGAARKYVIRSFYKLNDDLFVIVGDTSKNEAWFANNKDMKYKLIIKK